MKHRSGFDYFHKQPSRPRDRMRAHFHAVYCDVHRAVIWKNCQKPVRGRVACFKKKGRRYVRDPATGKRVFVWPRYFEVYYGDALDPEHADALLYDGAASVSASSTMEEVE